MPTLLAAPNLSIGPDRQALSALAAVYGRTAEVLDRSADEVHQRAVFTLAAEPAALKDSLLEGADAAIKLIDLGFHEGAHPRIGALDVCPVVFTTAEDRPEAESLAREVGEGLAGLGLPVFFYGGLAGAPERSERHHFRRGGIELLRKRMQAGEIVPDLGPDSPHPTAGAVLVTARPPLAAFNVELENVDIDRGREIAAMLRESGGGMHGVRAIAIALPSGRVQISTNVHDPATTRLGEVVAAIHRLAVPVGGRVAAAELIGLVPEAGLIGYPESVPIRDFDREQRTIEARLRALG